MEDNTMQKKLDVFALILALIAVGFSAACFIKALKPTEEITADIQYVL